MPVPPRVVVALAAVVLLIAGAAAQQPTFRSAVGVVPIYATVQAPDGRLAPGLDRGEFQVLDNGRPVEIAVFSSAGVPLTVALMLDTSSSMHREAVRVRQAASAFIDQLRAGDRVRLGTFGDEVAVSPLLTGDRQTLHRILAEEFWPGGETPLWTAIDRGMRSLAAEPGRRVVLVVTDGDDECSGGRPCASLSAVRRDATAQGVMIYAIGLAGAPLAGGLLGLAADTGGGHFTVVADADLGTTFARVIAELQHQYVLGFTPEALDGKVHRLEVRVDRPGYAVRARQSYLAEAAR